MIKKTQELNKKDIRLFLKRVYSFQKEADAQKRRMHKIFFFELIRAPQFRRPATQLLHEFHASAVLLGLATGSTTT